MNRNDSNKVRAQKRPLSIWNELYIFYTKTDYVQPLLVLLFFIFSVVFISFYVKDPEALAKSSYNYYFLLLLVLLGIGYYVFKNPTMISSWGSLVSQYPFFMTILFCIFTILFIIVYNFLSTTNSNTYYWTGRFIDIITIGIIVITSIFIIHYFINNGNLSQRGWPSVISDIILYLPCKLQEIFVWFLGEINNTPQKAYILLFIEIIILVWLFYYKKSMKWFSIGQEVFPIYSGNLYLKDRTPVTSYANISKETGTSNKTVPMNFGISFWLYLNDNTQTLETELPIFCYGGGEMENTKNCSSSSNPYKNRNVHPAITFIPTRHYTSDEKSENLWEGAGLTWNIGHLKIYFSSCSSSSENENSMIIDIPLQRWNLLSINYTSQQADIFVNGEIVASHTFTEPPVYSLSDSITIGGKDLQGAIKDIQYSVKPFSKISVSAMYNNNLLFSNVLPNFILR